MWNKDANVEKYKIEQNDVELIRIAELKIADDILNSKMSSNKIVKLST